MKSEITDIFIDFESWGDKRPCVMTVETEESDDVEYIDSAKDVISMIEEMLKTFSLSRETQIHISYKTETSIPLTMIGLLSMQEILYFRNKPKYGIDFLPPVKMEDDERKELVKNIFSNADEILQEEICEVFEYLLNTEVTE